MDHTRKERLTIAAGAGQNERTQMAEALLGIHRVPDIDADELLAWREELGLTQVQFQGFLDQRGYETTERSIRRWEREGVPVPRWLSVLYHRLHGDRS